MANGENHAKNILIDEAKGLADKLENGSAGDPEVMGRAISKSIRMTTAMFEQNFQTVEGCSKRHKDLSGKSGKGGEPIEIGFGPFKYKGRVTPTLLRTLPSIITCIAVLFALGRWQEWF